MLGKESIQGAHWRVGDIEEEGVMKIGTPMVNDDDGNEALLGIEGRLKGATSLPRIITIQSFPRPLLPALLTNNNGVPRTLQ